MLQVGERKLSSRISRLKRHLEKLGLKGAGDSPKDASRGRSLQSGTINDQQQEEVNRFEMLDSDANVPHLNPTVVTTHDNPWDEGNGVGSIVDRLSPSVGRKRGKIKSSLKLHGGSDLAEKVSSSSVLPSSPTGNHSSGVGGRKRSVWSLGLAGQSLGLPGERGMFPLGATSEGATGTHMSGTPSTAVTTAGASSARQANVVLSPDVLAKHNRLATTILAQSKDGTDGSVQPMREARFHSPSLSPASRKGGGGGWGKGDGGSDHKRCGGSRQHGGRPSGSPARSGDGSTSSQTKGFRRLTRQLSFRYQQSEANRQVTI